MTIQRITKRAVDALKPNGFEFTVWDAAVTGFGVRVRPTGAKSYVVVYRAGSGRGAPVRRFTIAAVGKIAPDRARARAKVILASVAHGLDPAEQKTTERGMPTLAELADRFMAEHVEPKRKGGTARFYGDILDRIVKPALGTTKADKLTRFQIGRLHSSLAETPFQANRVLAVVGSMYAFAGRTGIVREGTNPARGIDKFKESRRERFLTGEELIRLGSAIREAETTGIPWTVDETKPAAKHVPKAKRFTRIAPSAVAAPACFSSPAAACGKSCTCGGSTSISSVAVCSCPTARAAGRLSSSTPLLSRYSTRWNGSALTSCPLTIRRSRATT
jgi:hypothetical protein